MHNIRDLIGRDHAYAELADAFAATAAGRGGLVLLAGIAGVGKTRLAAESLQRSGLEVLRAGAPGAATSSAYGPLVAALRGFRRIAPDGLVLDHPLGVYLRVLLPELGEPPAGADRATIFEAVCWVFEVIARRRPTAVFLDDLHGADQTTLELLPHLAARLVDLPLLLLGAYRSDEMARDHPLRRTRAELRRAGRLRELCLAALRPAETADLAASILDRRPSPALAALIHDRTEGLPLFIEELTLALAASGRLSEGDGVLELEGGSTVLPLPETIRDLVLLRAARLSDVARAALEMAAVTGVSFDLDLVSGLAGGADGLMEALAQGWLMEPESGRGAFRHGLVREALYGDVPWPRRRALHREVAAQLARQDVAPGPVAEHWLAAREFEPARRALLLAASAACAVHAYPDAAQAARRAMELWPEGRFEDERIAALDQLARCAQLSGSLHEASRAWREVAEAYRLAGDALRAAEVQRRLAGVYELQGAWEQALAAREAAAAGFAAAARPGEAAAERLAAAAHLRSAASHGAALELLAQAAGEAEQGGRLDLQARILGLTGDVRARTGEYTIGLAQVRAGLALALEHNLTGPAAEVYQRLADALEHAGDYAGARRMYESAAEFCYTNGAEATAQLCLTCMSVVLCQTGEWDRCTRVCRDVLDSDAAGPHARAGALAMLGLVHAHRGAARRARPLLLAAARQAVRIEVTAAEILSIWGLAVVDDLEGAGDVAAERCRGLIERWTRTEERHYVVPALRWAATLLGSRGAAADTRACAAALARIVAETGTAEAIAALSHVLGELSLLDHRPAEAARHFVQSLDRLEQLDLPYERAHTAVRGGLALVAAGEREAGLKHLADAYRLAQSLGARPLATAAAGALAGLGEPVDRRLGRRAARLVEQAGLTRRELETIGLVALGHTDREIAGMLVLSPRTVEMHVANTLTKLGCRTRAEAVRRASELRLLSTADGPAGIP